jgi:hypothetical protein
MEKRVLWPLIIWVCLVVPALARPITPRDLVDSVEIGPVVVSSGGEVAFSVRHPFPSGPCNLIVKKFGDCELWAGGPGQAPRKLVSGGIQMEYSPDGEYLATLVPDREGCAVGLWSEKDGAYRELGRINEDFSDSHQQVFAWNPDGMLIFQRATGPDLKGNPQSLDSRNTAARDRMELLSYNPGTSESQSLDRGHHFEFVLPDPHSRTARLSHGGHASDQKFFAMTRFH